uniref:Uncharacterized protein n=1 Tax=Escherichia coli ACN001 TaxID=1311757 RepID=A0A140WYD9_ECOLX|nr:hypothetical protein J444_pB72 [Escherichia coli ACN001]
MRRTSQNGPTEVFIHDNIWCWTVLLIYRMLDIHPCGLTPGFSCRIHNAIR